MTVLHFQPPDGCQENCGHRKRRLDSHHVNETHVRLKCPERGGCYACGFAPDAAAQQVEEECIQGSDKGEEDHDRPDAFRIAMKHSFQTYANEHVDRMESVGLGLSVETGSVAGQDIAGRNEVVECVIRKA